MFNIPSFIGARGGAKAPFKFTINTANLSTGSTADNQFKLPLVSSLPLDAKVDWGDGSSDTITVFNQAETTHTYPSVGTYTIKITGDLSGWKFNNGGDRLKMLNVSQWSGLNISVDSGFRGCTNLTATATDAPLITSTSLENYFRSCTNFNGAIGNWDTSAVTNMFVMFNGAISFNQNIGSWNVSNVLNMQSMFSLATAFNRNIGNWNISNVSDFSNMFNGATAFNNGGSDDINNWQIKTTGTVNMLGMFRNATAFNQDIGSWNVSNVTNMSNMFNTAIAFNQNIGSWNVSNVSDFSLMFLGATSFNGDIGAWQLTSALNMEAIFQNATSFNRDISGWNTSSVQNMSGMFNGATSFNQNLSSWNVTNVRGTLSYQGFASMFNNATSFDNLGSPDINNWVITSSFDVNMQNMFGGSNTTLSCKFNQPINSWNTSRVTSMASMFSNNTAFNQNIGGWDVSKVGSFASMFNNATLFNNASSGDINNWILKTTGTISMQNMFGGTNNILSCKFNQNISSWNTIAVNNMRQMFFFNTAFNQNIGSWNVSNVTTMFEMFYDATSFNQDIGSWVVSNVSDFVGFMGNKTAANYSAANLDSIYNGWSSLPSLSPNESISFGSIKYTVAGAIGKNKLLNSPNNWVISDGGQNEPFQFTVKTDNAGVSTSTQFRMPLTTSTNLGFTVNWGDGVTETITDPTLAVHDYGVAGTYTISVTGSILGWSFGGGGDRLKMLNVLKWSGLNISVGFGFTGCTNLTATATDAPLITSTLLQSYFQNCSNFNGAIGNWDVSGVTNMAAMFRDAFVFNGDISAWDTSNVGAMSLMFSRAFLFNQDISTKVINAGLPNEYVAWDVSNVGTFGEMLRLATAFNQPIGNWDTSNVQNMDRTFELASSFNEDIGNWDVSSVTNMNGMFASATAFNQNIGAWNVSNVSTFSNMFSNATAFNNGGSDDINNWTIKTTGTVNMSSMFGGSSTGASCKFNRYIGDWNTSAVTNMSSMFLNNTAFNQNINTKIVNAGLPNEYTAWDTSSVTNMSGMFASGGATAFNQNIGAWDVSSVTTFRAMFNIATSFNNGGSSDINNWTINTSSAVDMSFMFGGGFAGLTTFNQPIGNWNTSAVTSMESMFWFNNAFNQNIGAWNVSSVSTFASMFFRNPAFNNGGSADINNWSIKTTGTVNMYFMFGGAGGVLTTFNQPVGNWNTSAVNNMASMFESAIVFNQDLNSWNTSNVTSMVRMFANAKLFNSNISNWNVSNVTSFASMFLDATAFNNGGSTDINNWNIRTTSAVSMESMFGGISDATSCKFNQPIGNWNTSTVTNMSGMFSRNSGFNQDIGSWNISNVTNIGNFMFGKTAANYSAANLDSIYNGWSSLPSLSPNESISFGSIKYTAAGQRGKDILTSSPNNWVVTDGGAIYETEYQDVLDEATFVGYTLPSVSVRNQQNLVVYTLKQTGIWTKLDIIHVFANDGGELFATLNWKSAGQYQASLNNAPVFVPNQGFQGDTIGAYINTNFIPSINAVQLTQDSAHIGSYNFNPTAQGGLYGSQGNNSTLLEIFSDNVANNKILHVTSGTPFVVALGAASQDGHYLASRNAPTSSFAYKNGVQIGTDATASTLLSDLNSPIMALTRSLNGNPTGFSDNFVAYGTVGADLVAEQADYHDTFNYYLTHI